MQQLNQQAVSAGITTEELAALFQVKPNTPRVSLTTHGHYFGIKPTKLPNRRLSWPLADVQRVLNGGAK